MAEVYENTLDQAGGELVTVLKCINGEISFPACELHLEALQIKALLQKYFQIENSTPENCLEKINGRPQNNSLATIRGNLELVNKAVEKIASRVQLQSGERVFCFCSREAYIYGTSGLLSNGYLVTSKRLLFWQDEEVFVLPIAEIHSLMVNPVSKKWYLNGVQRFCLCRANQEAEEVALILYLIFLLVKKESKERAAVEYKSEQQQNQTMAKQSESDEKKETVTSDFCLTDRLREAKSLYEEGLISEAEYSGLREKLLEKFV